MPSMASITVKKFDGTTDIVFDALSGSPGDGAPAVWRQDTGAAATLPNAFRPVIKMMSNWNGPKTARRFNIEMKFPYALLNASTGFYESRDSGVIVVSYTAPQAIPSSAALEHVAQGFNLLGLTSLIRSSMFGGYAPT